MSDDFDFDEDDFDEDEEDEEDEEEFDQSSTLRTGASERAIDELIRTVPATIPNRWLSVLRTSNGFQAHYPTANPPFEVFSTNDLCSAITDPQQWNNYYYTPVQDVVVVAYNTNSGHLYALDLKTVTADGDCHVVLLRRRTGEEDGRFGSIGEWLADNLSEEDWGRFQGNIPQSSEAPSDYDLIDAARRGHTSAMLRLLQAGVDVNVADRMGSALDQAITQEQAEAVRVLLEHKASINGGMVLEAARVGNKKVLIRLIEAGGDVNYSDETGQTPLEMAIEWRNHDVALILVQSGADPNKPGSNRQTPLSLAVPYENAKLIQAMIDHGADVNVLCEGRPVLRYARETNRTKMAELLRNAGARE